MRSLDRIVARVRGLHHAFSGGALILLYHRVAELRLDPWSLAVTPRNFAEHLQVLRQSYQVLALGELTAALRQGKVPPGSVVVTFDDGYADNLHVGKPLLERYGVPATVFVAAGALDSRRDFWWDELERVLLQPGTLPAELRLEIGGTTQVWHLADGAEPTPAAAGHHEGWKARTPPPSPRHQVYIALCDLLRKVSFEERQAILDHLVDWAGMRPDGRETHRALSSEEVRRLGGDGLVEIGAHTLTHPALATRPSAEQRDEIRGSKAKLEAILDRDVTSFSYPFGGSNAYSPDTVKHVRDSGFACACRATPPERVRHDVDPFQLPRIYVHDWDGEQFARQLSRYLRARTS